MAKFIPLTIEDNKYTNTWNPLRTISEKQIEQIIDSARSGRISQLQLLFSLVEQSDLTLGMCITRRSASLPDWTIKKRDLKKYRNFDLKLAEEQEDFLLEQFIRCEDSGTLLPALNTLQMAAFRGIGVVQPIYDEYGITKIITLDPWNFAVDYSKHNHLGEYPLYWNPKGADIISYKETLELIPENQVIANFNGCPIDSYGLQIYLASQLGMESYNKLISRKGLPATYIIAPEDLPQENLTEWARKAVDVTKGGSGAFPFGTQINTQNIDASNATAIQSFLEFLQKQIVLASTGGTLTSLAAATGLGSGLADTQNDVFKSICRNDGFKIGNLINRSIANYLLNLKFPNKPHLVYFDLENQEKQNPEKYLNDAVLAHNAGLQINIRQLQEMTGYTLEKEVATEDKSIWEVPKNEDKEQMIEWQDDVEKVITEEKTDEIPEEDTPEKLDEKIVKNSEDVNLKTGANLLKSFDKILLPIKQLFAKLFKAKDKSEIDEISKQIYAEIDKIENTNDNEFIQAMEQLYKQGFEERIDEE